MQVPAAAERNKGPILACAGAGSNAAHFARALPQTRWQPSDNRPGACAGDIAAYVEAAGLPNLLPPIPLDVSQGWESWGGTQPATLDLLVSINMMHIAELRCTEVSSPRRPLSPARAEEGALRGCPQTPELVPTSLVPQGLFRGAGVLLKPGGVLFTYGVGHLSSAGASWGPRMFEQHLGAAEQVVRRAAPGMAWGGNWERQELGFWGALCLLGHMLSPERGSFG
uniref:Methyltransferase-like 26 n=1 Tax=Malurus cyaneus samueli TaxID=2593467 RepID=A0A8C5UFQ8_9PASS